MKVHLSSNLTNINNDIKYLRQVVISIHEYSASLTLNWVEAAFNDAKTSDKSAYWGWREIISNNLNALTVCDALIIEGTNCGFFDGFILSRALDMRLPILYLSRDSISQHPIMGIDSKLISIKNYKNNSELNELIKDFIFKYKKNDKHIKVSDKARQYIRGDAIVSGKSESEIIDKLINEKISHHY